jgi:hypothetical protein
MYLIYHHLNPRLSKERERGRKGKCRKMLEIEVGVYLWRSLGW